MAKIGICSCHGKKTIIVNVRYNLCPIGNRERIDNTNYGRKKLEIKKQKEEEYKNTINKLDKKIDFCTGCNSKYKKLTNSHLIARSANKSLISEEKNITKHCLECHSKWESNDREIMMSLFDFWKNIRIIYELDKNHFEFLKIKLKLTDQELKENNVY